MEREDIKKIKEELGSGKLIELEIAPEFKQVTFISETKYFNFGSFDSPVVERFVEVESCQYETVKLIKKIFPGVDKVFMYAEYCEGTYTEREHDKKDEFYRSDDFYIMDDMCHFIISLDKKFNLDELNGMIVDGFEISEE